MIQTVQSKSNQEIGEILACLIKDIFINQLIIGDIHAPMNELSDVYKITKNNEIISGWTIFNGFDIPTIVFPPNLPESWDAIKERLELLNYPEIFITFPEKLNKSHNQIPWENWDYYQWKHMFTDNAMRLEKKSIEIMEISHLPKIRGASKDDLPKLNQFFANLKESTGYSGFWVPQQLKSDLYVIAEDENNQIIAVAGTHFETPLTVQIGNVHVLSEYRRQGIGKAISTAVVLGIMRFNKIPTLFVNHHNHAAQKMYEQIGFKEYNRFIFYKGIRKH